MDNGQKAQLNVEQQRLQQFKAMGLQLDMSRGKPCKEQLDLSMGLLDAITSSSNLIVNKNDYRNYGILAGVAEIKKIFCEMLNITDDEIIVAGNSSLNLMYDTLQLSLIHI